MVSNYIRPFYVPIAHLATVLLEMYKDREEEWKSCKKGKKSILSTDKDKAPAIIYDAHKHGEFLKIGKFNVIQGDKTFLVAFPGYDVRQVAAIRKAGIENAVKRKKDYVDQPLS